MEEEEETEERKKG